MKKILLSLFFLFISVSLVACAGQVHIDSDHDSVCDICGGALQKAECIDADKDGVCDACGKECELPYEGEGVPLILDGVANFQLVVGSDAMSKYGEINAFLEKLNASHSGEDVTLIAEGKSEKRAVELLIGTISSRGKDCKIDKYSLGMEGYVIKVVGTRLVVAYGGDKGFENAMFALANEIFSFTEEPTPISELIVTDSIIRPQTGYFTESVTIDGTELENFVIAIDGSSTANSIASKYQGLIYEKLGKYLKIEKIEKLPVGKNAIKIITLENYGEKTTPEGFSAYIEDGSLVIECEFPDRFEETVKPVFDMIINSGEKNVALNSDFTYKKNIRIITYEEFEAVGDGKTDDFFAIKAAHDYANMWGHEVHATAGHSYYIGAGTKGQSIAIKTDTYWNGCKFIFDDSEIHVSSGCGCATCHARTASIFLVKSDDVSFSVTNIVENNLPLLNSFDGEGTKKIEGWSLDYLALVHVKSNERRVFIRTGANADQGDPINEVILVHPDGTIDPSTPISWDYYSISSATAYSANDRAITIDGGGAVINTIANRPENNDYIQFARNIKVMRSNTTVKNFRHTVEEEQEFRAPYAGIIRIESCNNVTFENIVLQAARRKFVAVNNQQGTYEIGGYASNDIKYINVNASNFFATGANHDYRLYGVLHKEGEVGNRGMMGSNYCRNFYFKDCRIVNFDAHKGLGNLTIENCEIQGILVMGSGEILVKDTVSYVDQYKSVIQYRSDYGASYRGSITFDNVEIKYTEKGASNNELALIKVSYNAQNDYDKDYDEKTGLYVAGKGSTNYMCDHITIKNVKLTKYSMVSYIAENEDGYNDIVEKEEAVNEKLYIFTKKISTGYPNTDISKFKADGGYSDLNRYIPPEIIEIENSHPITLPKSPTFKNTKVIVDGEEVELDN